MAETDGSVTGFAGIRPARDADADPAIVGEVTTIYLTPGAWDTGTGRRLMTAALHTLTEAGYRQATLWVLDTNTRARRFYEKTGWHHDGTAKHDTSRGFPVTELRYRHPIARPPEAATPGR